MVTSTFDKIKQVLNSVIIGDCCKETPFEESASKTYLDDIIKDSPDIFTDKGLFLDLLCTIVPSEDILINMAYGLAYCMPTSRDVKDALEMFYREYCDYIGKIYMVYADDALKRDKDVLLKILSLYGDERVYADQYLRDVGGLPECCRNVPHELLMEEEVKELILKVADPAEIYCDLLTEEEKRDKKLVCRLLEEYRASEFSDYKDSFCRLCDGMPHEILTDEEVKKMLFEIGVPSVIYDKVLTKEEKLDDHMLSELLRLYQAPHFPGSRRDHRALRKMWAEAVYEEIYRFTDALKENAEELSSWLDEKDVDEDVRPYIERLPVFFDLLRQFFVRIGECPDISISEQADAFWQEMTEMDYEDELSPGWHSLDLLKGGAEFRVTQSFADSFEAVLKPYRHQMDLFDERMDLL